MRLMRGHDVFNSHYEMGMRAGSLDGAFPWTGLKRVPNSELRRVWTSGGCARPLAWIRLGLIPPYLNLDWSSGLRVSMLGPTRHSPAMIGRLYLPKP